MEITFQDTTTASKCPQCGGLHLRIFIYQERGKWWYCPDCNAQWSDWSLSDTVRLAQLSRAVAEFIDNYPDSFVDDLNIAYHRYGKQD